MKRSFLSLITGVLFLFFIPYFLIIFINGLNTALTSRKFNMEMILPILVASQMGKEYELEALKAQTIIARSNFSRKFMADERKFSVFKDIREEIKYKKEDIFSALIENSDYEKAVTETENKVLESEGELKLVPYHEISAGKTREGEEVLHSTEYSYLKSVESSIDKESENFLNSTYINQSVLPEKLVIKSRDSAGYVTEILADGNVLEGEAFRKGMGLTSANFTIQRIGKEVRFLCKGKGHGLGFSQYGGNEMAKDKKTAEEILEFYFPEMQIRDYNADYGKTFSNTV